MDHWAERHKRKLAWIGLTALALIQAGCLAAAATCAGAGAVGYAYYSAKVTRDYAAGRQDVWNALQASLRELQMPQGKAEYNEDEWVQESLTADGDKVRITLETRSSRIPAEGELTQMSIRVATFGDSTVSNRILDQVGLHLVPASQIGGNKAPVGPRIPPQTDLGPPPQSPPPPLANEPSRK